jgi:putative transposase
LLKDVKPPKVRYAAIKVMAAEKLPIQSACLILDVSESGFYAWRVRPPSERSIRHAWLTDLVSEVHDCGVHSVRPSRRDTKVQTERRTNSGFQQTLCRKKGGHCSLKGFATSTNDFPGGFSDVDHEEHIHIGYDD